MTPSVPACSGLKIGTYFRRAWSLAYSYYRCLNGYRIVDFYAMKNLSYVPGELASAYRLGSHGCGLQAARDWTVGRWRQARNKTAVGLHTAAADQADFHLKNNITLMYIVFIVFIYYLHLSFEYYIIRLAMIIII